MRCNSRENQQRILEFIKGYIAVHKQSPTIREIGSFVGYSSVSGVHEALDRLERRGFIKRTNRSGWRNLEIVEQPKVYCSRCDQDLHVKEFGFCRARRSGRNLYCRSCIRTTVRKSRTALKDYKSAKKRRAAGPAVAFEPQSDADNKADSTHSSSRPCRNQ